MRQQLLAFELSLTCINKDVYNNTYIIQFLSFFLFFVTFDFVELVLCATIWMNTFTSPFYQPEEAYIYTSLYSSIYVKQVCDFSRLHCHSLEQHFLSRIHIPLLCSRFTFTLHCECLNSRVLSIAYSVLTTHLQSKHNNCVWNILTYLEAYLNVIEIETVIRQSFELLASMNYECGFK